MRLALFKRSQVSHGWTLIELLMVAVIVAALATIAFPAFSFLKEKAGFAACVSHLRSLHTCFTNYMLDNEMVWPQVPVEQFAASEDETKEWKWWNDTLKPYGSSKALWICPADSDTQDQMHAEGVEFAGSYIPTEFDNVPNTAFKWSTQPWLLERGSLHGKKQGPNLLMPDGTVRQGHAFFPQ